MSVLHVGESGSWFDGAHLVLKKGAAPYVGGGGEKRDPLGGRGAWTVVDPTSKGLVSGTGKVKVGGELGNSRSVNNEGISNTVMPYHLL